MRAEIVLGGASALPWPEASFMVIMCIGAFAMSTDPPAVVAEMFRVLRPGGRAVLNIGWRVDEGTETHRAWGEFWVWADDDVQRMVEQAGFRDVTIQYVAWAGDGPADRLFAKVAGPFGGDMLAWPAASSRSHGHFGRVPYRPGRGRALPRGASVGRTSMRH